MSDDKTRLHQFYFDLPSAYQIWVGGRIDPSWSDRLAGMSVQPHMRAGGANVTLLQGELPDQAALVGLLNNLYELHFVVLAVLRDGEDMGAIHDP
ncbi:MAG: hypothetical protein R6W76_09890 [Caldilinea sp.]